MFDERPTEPITPEQQQISDELMASMKSKISEALQADMVKVADVFGNHQHVSIEVVSHMFEDKTSVQRQRMVYQVPVQLQVIALPYSSLPTSATSITYESAYPDGLTRAP
jgi:stress-induced morphogen